MNQVERTRRFAQLAYSAALGEIVREFDEKRHALRVRLAICGRVVTNEHAKLDGEQITAAIKAQLNTLLDGYELNGVPVDDEMAATIASEVGRSLEASITRPAEILPGIPGMAEVMKCVHVYQVRRHVGISPAWIRNEIDRRRSIKTPQTEPFTLYQVDNDNPQVNVDRADNSVTAVIRANGQLFADLRHKIEACLREGSERTVILEKLSGLEQAQSPQLFAQSYSDFISAAARHILLLIPFNPSLTEMVHKVLA